MQPPNHDRFGRPLRSLRLSVTDRCNLRCSYCMPEENYVWLPREGLLTFEELARVVRSFTRLGVSRVRLTGGEPLLRRDLPELVAQLARLDGLDDVALTTNGVLLAEHVVSLRAAGLGRVTVSLDTLSPERFRELTRRDDLRHVLRGIDAARDAGVPVKLDTVLIRGKNDDEILPLLDFAQSRGAELRFIEYMDVGGATRWNTSSVVARADILDAIRASRGEPEPLGGRGSAPAERFRLRDATTFGVIASVTEPFCGTCDRGRVTADGLFLTCLYAREGLDLKASLRGGASDDELATSIGTAWHRRDDRGAEQRAADPRRDALVPVEALRRDPHLEMHTRGG